MLAEFKSPNFYGPRLSPRHVIHLTGSIFAKAWRKLLMKSSPATSPISHTSGCLVESASIWSKEFVCPISNLKHCRVHLLVMVPNPTLIESMTRWYVANVSIIFDAPCLFYVNCYMFLYVLWHFYAFSGTNLLTRCHSANFCFLLSFVRKVSREIFSELDENLRVSVL